MDPYYRKDSTAPYSRGAVIVLDAAIDRTDALFIGGAGNLTVTMQNGIDLTLTGVPVGVLHLAVTKVKAAGTTATNMAALYRN